MFTVFFNSDYSSSLANYEISYIDDNTYQFPKIFNNDRDVDALAQRTKLKMYIKGIGMWSFHVVENKRISYS